MKTELHTIRGASLERIEELSHLGKPDWAPYRVAIVGTETSALDAAMGGDTKDFSGVLRDCSRCEFAVEGYDLTDEDGRLHDLSELLDDAAERLDQAEQEWLEHKAQTSTLKMIVDRFPGFTEDDHVNGADLVEFIGELLEQSGLRT